jgi:hypothetical protein
MMEGVCKNNEAVRGENVCGLITLGVMMSANWGGAAIGRRDVGRRALSKSEER